MNGTGVDNQGIPAITDDALSGAIGKLLEHPELITMVANALGTKPQGNAPQGEMPTVITSAPVAEAGTSGGSQGGSGEALSTLMPMLGKLSSIGAGGSSFKHEALLCALKPYLNEHRRDTIDYIIRISKISSIIGGMR